MGKLPSWFRAPLQNILGQSLPQWLFHLEPSLLKSCATLLCQLWLDSPPSDTAETLQGCFHVRKITHPEELQLPFCDLSGSSLLANPEHPEP